MAVPLVPAVVLNRRACAWDVKATPGELARWRAEVGEVATRWGGGEGAVDSVRLAATELLSNVARHVDDPRCRLAMATRDAALYLMVRDRCATFPAITEPDWTSTGGRGLWLLREMAGALGCQLSPGPAKWVWARYDEYRDQGSADRNVS
ncbi:hypothetical protein GCM10022245_67930 [Streptomyces mayteni]